MVGTSRHGAPSARRHFSHTAHRQRRSRALTCYRRAPGSRRTCRPDRKASGEGADSMLGS